MALYPCRWRRQYSSSLHSLVLAQQMQMEPNIPAPFAYLNELFRPTGGGPAQGDTEPELPLATAQSESEKMMWTEYMKDAERYDSRDADAWKGDSDGILVFVRPTLQ